MAVLRLTIQGQRLEALVPFVMVGAASSARSLRRGGASGWACKQVGRAAEGGGRREAVAVAVAVAGGSIAATYLRPTPSAAAAADAMSSSRRSASLISQSPLRAAAANAGLTESPGSDAGECETATAMRRCECSDAGSGHIQRRARCRLRSGAPCSALGIVVASMQNAHAIGGTDAMSIQNTYQQPT